MCVCFPRFVCFFSRRDWFWWRRTIGCKYASHAVTEKERKRIVVSGTHYTPEKEEIKLHFFLKNELRTDWDMNKLFCQIFYYCWLYFKGTFWLFAKKRVNTYLAIHGVSDLLHLLLPAGLWGAPVGAPPSQCWKQEAAEPLEQVMISPLHFRAAASVTLFKKQLWRTLLLCNFTHLFTC